ncbi:MAG TPA: DUF899 domain-containing protein [Stellaceae bacterium]|nr:DUF899 domain-containing protein [Stellaceae bacterium]
MTDHQVVTSEEWLAARRQLLAKEKEFTRLRDQLSRARRDLPWEKVAKNYVFDGPAGPETLAQLFDGRSQLVVYHFMFGPDWDSGCKSCSFWADNFERNVVHLAARDVTLVAVSRAPFTKLDAFRKRLGWTFKWVSSGGNDFNFDYHVSFTADELGKGDTYYNYGWAKSSASERPGISVFFRDGDAIFHTYSCYERGLDMMNAAYHYLDLVPRGRDEADRRNGPQGWVRYRDSYGR